MDPLSSDTSTRHLTLDELIPTIVSLLDALEIPNNFNIPLQELTEQFNETQTISAFKSLVNDLIELLHQVRCHTREEQKETANLLNSLTEQLSELVLKATGASHSAQISAQKRYLLDTSVSAQMSDLEKSSSEATTLAHLKELINTKLFSIRNEIKVHLQNEEQHRLETENQLIELTLKIKALEDESSELRGKLAIANNQATRDTLTGLPNRLAYDETLPIEIARWQRYHSPLSMAIWDIDLFKAINDTYGHKAGDKALTIIAKLLKKHCRKTDFVSRFGGEEFVMLLPNTNAASALLFANKIRMLIEKTGFTAGGEKVNVTISCGISEFKKADSGEKVFERSDKALYQAKANGRNQCLIFK